MRFLTVWMLLSLWDLHGRGRGLWIAQLGELSARTAWRRRLALVLGIGLFWLAVAPGLARLASALLDTPLDAVADQVPAILAADTIWADAKLLSIGLSPFFWLTEPLLRGSRPRHWPPRGIAVIAVPGDAPDPSQRVGGPLTGTVRGGVAGAIPP